MDGTADAVEGNVTAQPLIELTCATDPGRCSFASWLVIKEDEKGRKNVFTLETACQIHKKSGTGQPTLAARKAGENLLANTMNRVRTAHSRSNSPFPGPVPNGRGRGGASGRPVAPSMAHVSRLRWTRTPDEPNLPVPPLPPAPTEPTGGEDDIEEHLEALGLATYASTLRAAGVDTVDTLLTLEEDEWSTLVQWTHYSDPPLSRPESQLLHNTISPLLIGRSDR